MNKNIYQCTYCQLGFDIDADMLTDIEIKSPSGEILYLVIVTCCHCESVSLPDGYNQMSYPVHENDVETLSPGSEVVV